MCLSGLQKGALSPAPPLSAPALSDKLLVALGTGVWAQVSYCPVSPVAQPLGELGGGESLLLLLLLSVQE